MNKELKEVNVIFLNYHYLLFSENIDIIFNSIKFLLFKFSKIKVNVKILTSTIYILTYLIFKTQTDYSDKLFYYLIDFTLILMKHYQSFPYDIKQIMAYILYKNMSDINVLSKYIKYVYEVDLNSQSIIKLMIFLNTLIERDMIDFYQNDSFILFNNKIGEIRESIDKYLKIDLLQLNESKESKLILGNYNLLVERLNLINNN